MRATAEASDRAAVVQPVYRQIVLELERRRLAIGISMERLSEVAGIADRAYSKYLHSGTLSGRMAQWRTLQCLADALYPDGLDIRIVPRKGPRLDDILLRHQVRTAAALNDRKHARAWMSEIGRRASAANRSAGRKALGRRRLRQIAKLAARARWRDAGTTAAPAAGASTC